MFNIYYINNEKASEISMLFDNQIFKLKEGNEVCGQKTTKNNYGSSV